MPRLWKHPQNGRYYALWQQDGHTRRKSLKTSDETMANRRLRVFKSDLLAGKVKPISRGIRQTLFPFVDEFLAFISAHPDIALGTERLYSDALHKAKVCWGDMPLNNIRDRHLEKLQSDMARDGLKPPTINKNYRHIKAALRKGFKWYKIPLPEFPPQIKERKSARFFQYDDLNALFGVIDDKEFADFCLLAIYSGLRSGEHLRLLPSDIDNPEGWLRIGPERKNGEELRIPINKAMRDILQRCRVRSQTDGRMRLFRFRDQTDISHRFKAYARAAGLPNARFHDMRHTYGTHMAMAGVPEKALQKLLGHKSPASTNVYMDFAPDQLIAASNKLNYGPLLIGQRKNRGEK